MGIDFSPISDDTMKFPEFVEGITIEDLRTETNMSIDYLLDLVNDLNDADIVFNPKDENANDPYAVEGEENIGWTLGHLIAHVTASSEEGAAFSSLLARGIEAEERPRYETPWRDMTTKAQTIQRIEESRRIRLAYLDTWPDEPHLDVHRKISERFTARFGNMNATAAFLFGLMHEHGHYDQIKDVKQQALNTKSNASA